MAANMDDHALALRLGLEDMKTRLLTLEWQENSDRDEMDLLRQTIEEWEAHEGPLTGQEQRNAASLVKSAEDLFFPDVINDIVRNDAQASTIDDLSDVNHSLSSAPGMRRRQWRRPLRRKKKKALRCVICLEKLPFQRRNRLECRHHMCDSCLRELFLRATNDRTLMPARCCNHNIPPNRVYNPGGNVFLLSHAQLAEYKLKGLEFSQDRPVYCSDTNCGSFIPPKYIEHETVTCPRIRAPSRKKRCGTQTCTRCRGAAHLNELECPSKDDATIALETLAGEQGWRQCERCHRFVELSTGCNHMTCRCGNQFCYACGQAWRTCACPGWDEAHLVEQQQA